MRKNPNGKILIQPSRKATQGLQSRVRQIIEVHRGNEAWTMIRRLNRVIRGWCNYHRHSCASQIFYWFDGWLFWTLKRWLHRRHPNKGRRWLQKIYYRYCRGMKWSFHASRKQKDGKIIYIDLLKAGWTKIVRHIKVRANANPFDPEWSGYFDKRRWPQYRLRRAVGSIIPIGEYGWS